MSTQLDMYVARSTGGDGMTHWYEYWNGYYWTPHLHNAYLYEREYDAERVDREMRELVAPERQYKVIKVAVTIKELG